MENRLGHPRASWIFGLAAVVSVTACGRAEAPLPAAVPAPTGVVAEAASTEGAAQAPHENRAPRIGSITLEPERPIVGQTLRVSVDAEDPDGDPFWLRYEWLVEGEPVEGADEALSLEGLERGDSIDVAVIATDGKDESEPTRESLFVANAAPRIVGVGVPGGELRKGATIRLAPRAEDIDADAIEFRYVWTANGRPLLEDGPELATERLRRGDVIRATVTASDGESESEPFVIPELTLVNEPPEITSRPGGVSPDGVFRYAPVARDPEDDALTYGLEDAPDGMAIDAVTGSIVWTPAASQQGVHRLIVVVNDRHGGEVRQEIEINVSAPTDSERIASRRR